MEVSFSDIISPYRQAQPSVPTFIELSAHRRSRFRRALRRGRRVGVRQRSVCPSGFDRDGAIAAGGAERIS